MNDYERGRADAERDRDRSDMGCNIALMIIAAIVFVCCSWACHVFETQVK